MGVFIIYWIMGGLAFKDKQISQFLPRTVYEFIFDPL